jgi:hypothetical protein
LLHELHLTVIPFGFEQAVEAGTSDNARSSESTSIEHWIVQATAVKLGATAIAGERCSGE